MLKTQVYLNNVLRGLGYLSFSRPSPQAPEDIHASSLAFAMDPNRIYLNSKERFKEGRLGPAEKEEVRARLKSDLENIRLVDVGIQDQEGNGDNPEGRLFAEVRTKEEVYHGDCLPFAPDLVIIPRPGYDLKATLNVAVPAMKDIFSGMHTHDDAFLIVNSSTLPALSNPKITDVASLVREALVADYL
jgi:predicted AlkP superfamily phosphohydrolase/phosphomutase